MRNLYALIAGTFFGLGLMYSDMTDTQKVQGWLNIFGDWDPTLAFVLGGAILPMLVAWQIAKRRSSTILGGTFPVMPEQVLDRRLIIGSALFGFGWALVGLCPGPTMASLLYGGSSGLIFFAAMAAGMMVQPKIPVGVPA